MLASLLFFLTMAPQPESAKDPAQESEAAQAPAEEGVASEAEVSVYTYNPFGKRDPFKSYISEKVANAVDLSNPLLAWDLSRFTLTGVIWGIANPKAIVRDGNGRGHVISRGTRIGRNKGQVIRILKAEVVVQEEFRDPLGKLIVSEFALKLARDDQKNEERK